MGNEKSGRRKAEDNLPEWNGEKLSPFGMYEELAPHIRKLVYTALRNAFVPNRAEAVEDIVQDCFLRAHRYFDKFDPSRGKGTPEETLKAWMSRLTWQHVNQFFSEKEFKLRDKPQFTLEENITAQNMQSESTQDHEDGRILKAGKSLMTKLGHDWDDLVNEVEHVDNIRIKADASQDDRSKELSKIVNSARRYARDIIVPFPHPDDIALLDSINPQWRELKEERDSLRIQQSRPICKYVSFSSNCYLVQVVKKNLTLRQRFERFSEVQAVLDRIKTHKPTGEAEKWKGKRLYKPRITAHLERPRVSHTKVEKNIYLKERNVPGIKHYQTYIVVIHRDGVRTQKNFKTIEEAVEFRDSIL